MRKLHTVRVWAPLVCACLLATTMPLSAQPGGATPEEVFERFKAASEGKDWQEMAACITPEALIEMNASMVAVGGMVVAFAAMGEEMGEEMAEGMEAEASEEPEVDAAALTAEFEQMLASHGLDEEAMDALESEDGGEEMPEAFASPAFFADIMGFIDSLPGEEGQSLSMPEGELEDLVIDGDVATASLAGNEGRFVRVDDRWYIDLGMGESSETEAESEVEIEMEEEAAE